MIEPFIRRATQADSDSVRDLTRSAYAKWCAVIGREPKPMSADYQSAIREHLIDLAFAGDRLAGLVEMIPDLDHLLIENVAVSPDLQGAGIGRHLMRHAEMIASERGLREIRLYTNKLFTANIEFYARLGHRVDREEAFKGGYLTHMSKRLSSAGNFRSRA